VIAVLAPGFIAGDESRPALFVVSDVCTFMPTGSALVVVDGLGDRRVAETVGKLRDARTHPDRDPNARPPSTAPASARSATEN
jgi:hypothetical protein